MITSKLILNRKLLMDERFREKESSSLVLCVWCGAKIRDDKDEDTTGVCLKCFYQILSNHLQAQKGVTHAEFASDR